MRQWCRIVGKKFCVETSSSVWAEQRWHLLLQHLVNNRIQLFLIFHYTPTVALTVRHISLQPNFKPCGFQFRIWNKTLPCLQTVPKVHLFAKQHLLFTTHNCGYPRFGFNADAVHLTHICEKSSLSTSYNGNMTHQKQQKWCSVMILHSISAMLKCCWNKMTLNHFCCLRGVKLLL